MNHGSLTTFPALAYIPGYWTLLWVPAIGTVLLLPGWTLVEPRPFAPLSLRAPVTRDSRCYPPAKTFGHQCQPGLVPDFKCPFSHCSSSNCIPSLVMTALVPWPRPAPTQPTSPSPSVEDLSSFTVKACGVCESFGNTTDDLEDLPATKA